MESVDTFVADAFHTIGEARRGLLHSWDEHGGIFLFLAEGSDSFDDCCLTAVQMLEMMPSINEDVRLSADIARPVEVCILCDTGLVAYATNPSEVTGKFVDKLIEHRRWLGAKNSVTITERVYRQLSRPSKSQFTAMTFSRELDLDLHSTAPVGDEAVPDESADAAWSAIEDEFRPAPGGSKSPGDRREQVKRALRRLVDRRGPGTKVAALAGTFLAGLVIGRLLFPPAAPPAQAAPVTVAPPPPVNWNEPFSSAEWIAWRKHAHDTLDGAKVTEKTVIEALQGMPSAELRSPAAYLRRHEEIADVLLKYKPVSDLLYDRFGIDDFFLGTGMSNPVSDSDYGKASVHEYLVPNRNDDGAQIWMRKLKSFPMDLETTVGGLIEKSTDIDPQKEALRKDIVDLARPKNRETRVPPVIRFAQFNEVKYSRKLGPDGRTCVFASDLAEVWDLKIKDAATRSGYRVVNGDTFFIWVFVPTYPKDVVPATWENVLKNLPSWLEPHADKAP
jgi:hypothetical protein